MAQDTLIIETRMTGNMGQGMQRLNQQTEQFNKTIGRSRDQAQFLRGVLEAFVLYKGFVFLQTQVQEFTRALVETEHEIAIVQTQLNHLGQDFQKRIRREVIDVARETGLAMQELAKAEFEVVSANIDVADSFRILELSAKAAAAGGIQEVETAFNAALSQVNAFNLSTREFGRVFDLQFNLVKRGIFTYEQLAGVIGNVSIAFAGMNQSIETSNAALAAISQIFTGRQLEQGATGLRNAVLRMTNSFEQFEEFGVDVIDDASGDFRDFNLILRDLGQSLDGLSESARSKALKELFPDKRERRGIQALLTQTDQFEQFFIEQQFAAGDLNTAFETVNDTLLTQARILKNDLIPAFEPFVDALGSVVSGINNINEALPGMTQNLIRMATIGAVFGGMSLLAGGRVPGVPAMGGLALRRQFQGPAFGPMGARRLPTGLGLAGAGLVGGMSLHAGLQPGSAGAGDFLGAGLTGAATGAFLGGPVGAAIGAAVSIGALALGDALGDEAEPVAKTFSERFSEALSEQSGDIAGAFISALEKGGQEGGGTLGVAALLSGGLTVRRELPRGAPTVGGVPLIGPVGTLAGMLGAEGPRRFRDVGFLEADEARARLAESVGAFRGEVGTIEDITGATLSTGEREMVARAVAEREFEGTEAIDAATNLIRILSDTGATLSEITGGLDMFNDLVGSGASETEALTEVMGHLRDVSEEVVAGFGTIRSNFEALATGNFEAASNVFARLGDEGERLAKVFAEIAKIQNAFGMLQTLNDIMITDPALNGAAGATRERIRELSGSGRPQDVAAVDALKSRLDKLTGDASTSLLEELFGEDFALEVGKSLKTRLEDQITQITGGEDITPEAFVSALMGAPTGAAAMPGSTNLDSALFDAAEAVRMGLIDPLGFTGDQLEMMGEELREFNRLIAQANILEELQRIAQVVDPQGGLGLDMQAVMSSLLGDVKLAGQNFMDIMSDPEKLAELLSNLEFGEVNITDSHDQNFIVRIEGAADPSQAAQFADAFIETVRNKQREALSR